MNFVTDTHALLWWFTDSPKISPKASEIFQKCEKGENIIFIPSIVIAEGLSIFEKKRISFDFKKLFRKIYESANFVLIPLDYSILRKMVDLKEIPELHDKIIVSTARYLNSPLLTKDRVLQDLPYIKTVW
jgi:PIN domain nuclease of toxin-antitoxin system